MCGKTGKHGIEFDLWTTYLSEIKRRMGRETARVSKQERERERERRREEIGGAKLWKEWRKEFSIAICWDPWSISQGRLLLPISMSVKRNDTVNFKSSICDVLLKVSLTLNCALVTSWYRLGLTGCWLWTLARNLGFYMFEFGMSFREETLSFLSS